MVLPIENNGQIGLLAASAISISIAAVFVVLRLIAKHMGTRIDYSDYCIVVALVSNLESLYFDPRLTWPIAVQYGASRMQYATCHLWGVWLPYG
jgi:hypothetical protein